MSTRRKFLFDCSSAVAALTLVPMSLFSLPAITGGEMPSPKFLNYQTLAGQINTVFRVRLASGQAVELKLLKAPLARPTPVRPGCRLPGDAGHEKFSLIFSGPKEGLLASAIHQFEHQQLGRFEMHIGSIGALDTEAVRYEAVFNQPASVKGFCAAST